MADCIFCRIVAGEIPGQIVAETDHALALLDVQPLRDGHVLVIPKTHVARVEDLQPSAAGELLAIAGKVARVLRTALGAEGTTMGINDGAVTGQTVPHVHLHIVPRSQGDGAGSIHSIFPGFATEPTPLEAIRERLQIPRDKHS